MHESFWAKVLFREFTGHFIAMNEQEIVADVKASIVALTRLSEEGDSFGAKMVRWANERMASNAAKASAANGSKGGRPRKTQSTTAAGESADPKSDSPPKDGGSAASAGSHYGVGEADVSPEVSGLPRPAEGCASGKRIPPSTAELYDFAEAARLNEADAREWWELCTERGWKDRSGKPIRNWKAACERYCAKRAANRLAAATRVE